MADEESDWPDPPMEGERDVGRLRVRLLCSAVVLLAFLALSWGYVGEVAEMLWPPHESLSRWATLVLLQLMGYVILPLLVGGLVGDLVYDRFVDG
jgi:antibiotic biosynthesis monooxygenase (ABM) superfamily enzyme